MEALGSLQSRYSFGSPSNLMVRSAFRNPLPSPSLALRRRSCPSCSAVPAPDGSLGPLAPPPAARAPRAMPGRFPPAWGHVQLTQGLSSGFPGECVVAGCVAPSDPVQDPANLVEVRFKIKQSVVHDPGLSSQRKTVSSHRVSQMPNKVLGVGHRIAILEGLGHHTGVQMPLSRKARTPWAGSPAIQGLRASPLDVGEHRLKLTCPKAQTRDLPGMGWNPAAVTNDIRIMKLFHHR